MIDFTTRVSNADFWFKQATQMYEASLALFPYIKLTDSANDLCVGASKGSAFLLGISIENAFKAVLVYRGLLKIEDKNKNNKSKEIDLRISFDIGRGSHDLYKYAEYLDVSLNENETELLKRLSQYTIWAGKYGTPLSEREFKKSSLFQKNTDFEVAEALLLRLKILAGFSVVSGWPAILIDDERETTNHNSLL